ncbi:MAG: hypothetical protein QM743_09375 [Chitinophagaceae bacterium]
MGQLIEEFDAYRSKMNEVILGKQNKVINRLFNLDTNTYAAGALDVKTKEMLAWLPVWCSAATIASNITWENASNRVFPQKRCTKYSL